MDLVNLVIDGFPNLQYEEYLQNIELAFLNIIIQHIANDITITTFRKNDKADLGQRQTLKQLGFVEAELLYEFVYPTQRFVLTKKEDDIHE